MLQWAPGHPQTQECLGPEPETQADFQIKKKMFSLSALVDWGCPFVRREGFSGFQGFLFANLVFFFFPFTNFARLLSIIDLNQVGKDGVLLC